MRRIVAQRELRPGAVKSSQARANVRKPDAVASTKLDLRKTCAGVGHRDAQHCVIRCACDRDAAAFAEWIQSMLDRVFDQRQQHHWRERCSTKVIGYRNFETEPPAHPDPMCVEIRTGELDFLAES